MARMDLLITLMLDGYSRAGQVSTKSKIEGLLGLGRSVTEGATTIGKPLDYITATMSQKRQSAKRRNKKDA
jgi:hypothetical protein